MNELIRELKELLFYEDILLKEFLIEKYGWSINSFNNTYGENCLFVICCEYIPNRLDKNYHLHYDLCYGGSEEFNNILNKYRLNFDWVNACSVGVYSH